MNDETSTIDRLTSTIDTTFNCQEDYRPEGMALEARWATDPWASDALHVVSGWGAKGPDCVFWDLLGNVDGLRP